MIRAVGRLLMLATVALRNVRHGGRRTAAAILGTSLSLTLVLLQLGFLGAVRVTAVYLLEQLEFDAVLSSPSYDSLYDAGMVSLDRVEQASSHPNVEHGRPIWLMFAMWRCPPYPYDPGDPNGDDDPTIADDPKTGDSRPTGPQSFGEGSQAVIDKARTVIEAKQPLDALRDVLSGRYDVRPNFRRRELLAIGVDPFDQPFRDGPVADAIQSTREDLAIDARVLLNRLSHPDFGWDLRPQFSGWELDDSRVEVVGGFDVLKGFGADGGVITSRTTFLRHTRWPEPRSASVGLLKFRERDPDQVEQTLDAIRARLPDDVELLSRAQMLTRESDHWVKRTNTGLMFSAGVALAMVVAGVVVYQVLSSDVRNRLPEYATMKAIGYSNDAPVVIVVIQAAMLALLSYVPAVVMAQGLYWLTTSLAMIPMAMAARDLTTTLVLALVVGVGVSLLTVRKLRAANPADLF